MADRWPNTVRTALIAVVIGWLVNGDKIDDVAGTVALVALGIPSAAESVLAIIAGRKGKKDDA